MVGEARALLEERGVEPKMIHDELFFAGPLDLEALPTEPPPGEGAVGVELHPCRTPLGSPDASRREDSRCRSPGARELPFSCKGGMCASCKARLIEGEVEMEKNYALVDTDLDQGMILTCQSHPLTDHVVLDYDV